MSRIAAATAAITARPGSSQTVPSELFISESGHFDAT